MATSGAFLKPDVIARLAGVGLYANRVVEESVSGLHRSPLHGVSPEFADYREYTFGDDLKNLDWRAFARSDRFYIKRYEEESNLRAVIALDCSASMSYGRHGSTKFEFAATLAASLSALFVRQRDAVGLTTFSTQGEIHLRPSSMQMQLAKIVDVLETVTPSGETDLGSVLSSLSDQFRNRGMVIVISDLFTPLDKLYDALGKLQHGGHEILIFHVLDRDEIELPFQDSVVFRDIEGNEEIFAEPRSFRKAYRDAIDRFVNEVRQRCRYCGIDHIELTTDQDLGLVVSQYLHERQVRGPRTNQGRMSNLPDS